MKNSTLHLIGARIRAIRKAKGMTQEELAENISTQHSYIGYVERGEQNLTIQTLEKIADALSVEIRELFEYEGLKINKPKLWDIVEILIDKNDEELDRVLIILKQVFK